MIISKLNIGEAVMVIKKLIDAGEWRDAHRACIEVLRFDPENIRIIRLKNKIEKKVKKMNTEAIRDDLKQIMPLYKQKNYEALREHLKQLEPYMEQYRPLKSFILKVNIEYQKYMAGQREKYYRQEVENIRELIKQNKYQEAIRIAEKVRILNIHAPELKNLIAEIRRKWIENELKLKSGLLQSEKWEDIMLFYQVLLQIDYRSQKVKSLIETAKKRAKLQKVEEKRDYIYSGLEKIRTLFQLHKYESALMAAEEIMSIDPDNKQARKYTAAARAKVAKIIDRELVKQMMETQKNTREDFKINRKNYVRL